MRIIAGPPVSFMKTCQKCEAQYIVEVMDLQTSLFGVKWRCPGCRRKETRLLCDLPAIMRERFETIVPRR